MLHPNFILWVQKSHLIDIFLLPPFGNIISLSKLEFFMGSQLFVHGSGMK
jgi:hypothetical protein